MQEINKINLPLTFTINIHIVLIKIIKCCVTRKGLHPLQNISITTKSLKDIFATINSAEINVWLLTLIIRLYQDYRKQVASFSLEISILVSSESGLRIARISRWEGRERFARLGKTRDSEKYKRKRTTSITPRARPTFFHHGPSVFQFSI